MKSISAFFASGLLLFLFSCNSGEEKKEEPKTDTTTAIAPAPEKPAFSPFKIARIRHHVKDYAKWLPFYKGNDSLRMAHGISQFIIGRGLEDSNTVIIINKIADVQKAKDFAKLPDLKAVMQKAGVNSQPTFDYSEVIRNDNSVIEQKDRLIVSHHVKDFAAWLKVFDAEAAQRPTYGLIDRGLARGIDDPNMVYVVFAISDMAKAKARSASPELKKLMTDAGVDSKPGMLFYKIVDMVQ